MAEKISTIILSVDLDCDLCKKKIEKALSKFPEIQIKSYDTKTNTVTISGPFDPEKLSKCLSCRAGKALKGFQIVKVKKPEPKPDKRESPKKEAAPLPNKPDSPKKVDPKPEPVVVPVPIPVVVPIPITVVVKPAPEQAIPPPQPICHPAWPPCACGCGARPCSSGWPIHGGGCHTFFSEEDTTCTTM